MPERLLAIHTLLDELISLHQPAVVAVERLFFSKNAQTAMAVGQARGVVLLAAAQHDRPVRRRRRTRSRARSPATAPPTRSRSSGWSSSSSG